MGWDERADPRSRKPGQARNLEAIDQGVGTVDLDWKSPERTQATARPRAYRIERRIRDLNSNQITEDWVEWQMTALATEHTLANQPRAVEITYRVTAFNTNGDGPASNSVQVVL